jgi:hypothetical protein
MNDEIENGIPRTRNKRREIVDFEQIHPSLKFDPKSKENEKF